MQEQERFNILRENLKDLMSHRGYSSTRLAKECKTSEGKSCFTTSTITRFLKDPKATLRAGTIKELADFFNVPVDALFNKNVLQFCTELEKKPESATLIPLVTNDGALAICGYPSRWPNFPEIDPVCELLAMVPSPPLSPQKGFDFSKLFAQQISDSLMEPDFLSGDIVYLAPPTPGTKLDGKFALVRVKKQGQSLARIEEEASMKPESEYEDFIAKNSHEYVIRRVFSSLDGDCFAAAPSTPWARQEPTLLSIGDESDMDQILGVVVGKFSKL